MRILILGGTVFVGRALAEAALKRGHHVTLFNRGTHAGAVPGAEEIHGDRTKGLAPLHTGHWDAVIDTCGYVPRVVRLACQELAGRVNHTTFISTISVYADASDPHLSETSALATIEDETTEEVNGETYGALKALCEHEVEKAFPSSSLIVRPGLIVGPHDPTDRFTYWVDRIGRGGTVLGPGRKEQPVQVIDARDLAEWTLGMVENKVSGTYNACGPAEPLTFEQMLRGIKKGTGSDALVVWPTDELLVAEGVQPGSDLPFWIPESENGDGILQVSNRRAVAANLRFRPLEDTARDTWAWTQSRAAPLKLGLDPDREAQLIEKALTV
ncbi:MAG: NAD-dependent epimerase/dehydratase family protein [Fimbriimonadaceae bacterium]|nr:NAD-dependent epimerase/dehydratase family protein [Fimbriimonadaceae bacterium]